MTCSKLDFSYPETGNPISGFSSLPISISVWALGKSFYIGPMNGWLLVEIIYILIIVTVSLRIIYDTRSVNKTVSYLLMIIFLPILGILIYLTFGVNYRNRKIYSKKLTDNGELERKVKTRILEESEKIFEAGEDSVLENKPLIRLLLQEDYSPLTRHNKVEVLINGEEKFPRVKRALLSARHHIHIEYYIYEPDHIGWEIAEILMQKAGEGVEVRLMFDDFGSRKVRRKLMREIRKAGVEAYPFFKIRILPLANRINYRNHRKIIVVDGKEAFVGGINISDKYINHEQDLEKLYWRDTHLYMRGPAVRYLQYLFMSDWNFCAADTLQPAPDYFPKTENLKTESDVMMQIAASGPDSDSPTILYSVLQAIMLAKKQILVTTPYFIPEQSLKDLLIIAGKSGVDVRLLVPEKGDSRLVNAAARSYYEELMAAGVRIYLYHRGFLHAKTMVVDGELSMIGTANMDIRSFDLNFEVNAVIYNEKVASEMQQLFFEDLEDATEIRPAEWRNRSKWVNLLERIARLLSPVL